MSSFAAAWSQLLQNEGGYTVDNGGETMWGITEVVARRNGYVGEMRELPQSLAMDIAQREYWIPHQCDKFSDTVAFQILDAAYNGGNVNVWLQRAAQVKEDGVIGPKTIAAVNAMPDCKVVMRLLAYRVDYLTSLSEWAAASKGWANRIANNLLRASV